MTDDDEIIRHEAIDHLESHRLESESRRDREQVARTLAQLDATVRHLLETRGAASRVPSSPRYLAPLVEDTPAARREFVRRAQDLWDLDPSGFRGEERFELIAAFVRDELGAEVRRG